MLNQDYKEMSLCLNKEGAEFLVASAYSSSANGFPGSPSDFPV